MPSKKAAAQKFKRSHAKLKQLSFAHLIPNMATVIALCMGLSSIRFALMDRFDLSVICILAAAFFDAMDGRLARLLGAESDFGAELDSLSDFVGFGVAPAVVLYLLGMQEWKSIGWAICLFFAVCLGLRLARFNTYLRLPENQNPPEWKKNFFMGVPAPAGACIALTPLLLYLASGFPFFRHPAVLSVFMIGAGGLFISRLPAYSFKTFKLSPKRVPFVLLLVGLMIAFIISEPWYFLALNVFAYLVSLPFSYKSFKHLQSNSHEKEKHALLSEDEDGCEAPEYINR